MSKVIVGTGSYLPEWLITNDDLEAMGVGYDRARSGGKSLEQWSMERMGISTRHRVRPGEGTSDMGLRAAQCALEDARLEPADIQLIVMSSFTSDHRTPNSAGLMQAKLGCTCPFIQVDAACAGFVQATLTAAALMDYMKLEQVLVVSSDATSIYGDPDNFMLQTMVGDGAGAIILRDLPGSPYGIKATFIGGTGHGSEALSVPGGGAKEPISLELIASKRHYVVWDYKKVYTFAVQKVIESSQTVIERAGWRLEEVDWFVPHQAGRNILLDAARRMEVPEEKFILNMDHVGNTSGASMPLALDEANRAGKFQDGDKLVMPAMGSGLAWGALAVEWYDYLAARPNGESAAGESR